MRSTLRVLFLCRYHSLSNYNSSFKGLKSISQKRSFCFIFFVEHDLPQKQPLLALIGTSANEKHPERPFKFRPFVFSVIFDIHSCVFLRNLQLL